MISRSLAAFLGGFTLLNIAGSFFASGFDSNQWWLDLRPLPPAIGTLLLAIAALLLLSGAFRPPIAVWRKRATLVAAVVLALIALVNLVTFYALLARHEIYSAFPVPLSLLILVALVAVAVGTRRSATRTPKTPDRWIGGLTFAICMLGFPLAQTWFFGQTDYRRHADAIVVFGARTYADGEPSPLLADRVRTGVELYRQGLAPLLILSGGPGDGATSEPQAMSALAMQLGVPSSAIRLDEMGLNTQDTVRNAVEGFKHDMPRHPLCFLAVSHGYHLPRVKLTFQRAGVEAYTVPARETFVLPHRSFLLAREVVALWAYYLRPLERVMHFSTAATAGNWLGCEERLRKSGP